MSFEYTTLTPDEVAAIQADVVTPDPKPDLKQFIPAWEVDHAAHDALCKAQNPHPEDCTHCAAKATIEAAIAEARAN